MDILWALREGGRELCIGCIVSIDIHTGSFPGTEALGRPFSGIDMLDWSQEQTPLTSVCHHLFVQRRCFLLGGAERLVTMTYSCVI